MKNSIKENNNNTLIYKTYIERIYRTKLSAIMGTNILKSDASADGYWHVGVYVVWECSWKTT